MTCFFCPLLSIQPLSWCCRVCVCVHSFTAVCVRLCVRLCVCV